MKKLLSTFALVIIVMSSTACISQSLSTRPNSFAGTHRQEGHAAVSAVINAHKSKHPGQLGAVVSMNYYPSKQGFVNRIEQSSINKTILNIETFVNQAIIKGDKMSVNFKWNRTFIPKGSASQTRDSGTTNFVFVQESGDWRLVQVSGSNIFN